MIRLDAAILQWIVVHRIPFLDTPLHLLSVAATQGSLWGFLGIVLALFRRLSLRGLIRLLTAILVALVVSDEVIKPIANRGRPYIDIPLVDVIGDRPFNTSFPSGHAASSFAAALVLSRLVPGATIAWWVLAAVVSFSRVYIGVHYPIDVIAGALLGYACGVVVWRLVPDRRPS